MSNRSAARVLVVDNDERMGFYLRTILSNRGYEVYVVEGVGIQLLTEAETLARRARPHVAIVDLRLLDDYVDDRSGLQLLPKLKSARCILYSAYLASDVIREAVHKHHAFDWVDKQDLAALYNAVDAAAKEACAAHKHIQVQWPASWDRHQLIASLFAENDPLAAPLPEPAILDDLISQLFHKHEQVLVEAVDGSINGLQSVMRGRTAVAKIHPDDLAPKVLKLANAARGHREYDRYNEFVRNHVAGLFATQIENYAEFWDLGGAIYTFIGSPQQVLPTFNTFYTTQTDPEVILKPLEHFFREVWRNHYENSRPLEHPSLYAAYNEALKLEQKLAAIDPSLFAQLGDQLGVALEDPLPWVQHYGGDSLVRQARQAVTHGDLHSENLFVDGVHAWVIDFERTGPGHILRDFAELEVDLLTRLASPGENNLPTIFKLALVLAAPNSPTGEMMLAKEMQENDEAQKFIHVVQGLRRLAHEMTRYADQREYVWSLLFDALFVTATPLLPAEQRQRALLFSSVLCERLRHWGQPWPPKAWRLA